MWQGGTRDLVPSFEKRGFEPPPHHNPAVMSFCDESAASMPL